MWASAFVRVPGAVDGAAAAVWAEVDLPHVGISPEKVSVQQTKGAFRCFCFFMWLVLHSYLLVPRA